MELYFRFDGILFQPIEIENCFIGFFLQLEEYLMKLLASKSALPSLGICTEVCLDAVTLTSLSCHLALSRCWIAKFHSFFTPSSLFELTQLSLLRFSVLNQGVILLVVQNLHTNDIAVNSCKRNHKIGLV